MAVAAAHQAEGLGGRNAQRALTKVDVGVGEPVEVLLTVGVVVATGVAVVVPRVAAFDLLHKRR